MLIPRYLFVDDFVEWKEYFISHKPHIVQIKPGQYIWSPDESFQYVNFIESGLAKTYLAHESGRRKILSYHGHGTVFPVFHELDFKIEKSLVTEAFSPMIIWRFKRSDFKHMLESEPTLNSALLSWYARYVNLLIFETAHQEYNSGFEKVCNVLLLIYQEQQYEHEQAHTFYESRRAFSYDTLVVDASKNSNANELVLTQEELAEILGMSRVNLTRHIGRLRSEGIIATARKHIILLDLPQLMHYCSSEAQLE